MAIIKTSTTPAFAVPAFDATAVISAHRRLTESVGKTMSAFIDACIVAGIPRDEAGCKAVAAKVETDLLDVIKAGLVKGGVDISTLDRADLWTAAATHGFIARSTASALCNAAARMFYWSGQTGADGQPVPVRYASTLATDPRFALPWSKAFDTTKSVKADAGRVQVPAGGDVQTPAKATSRADLDKAIRNAIKIARALTLNGLAADLLDAARGTLTDFTE